MSLNHFNGAQLLVDRDAETEVARSTCGRAKGQGFGGLSLGVRVSSGRMARSTKGAGEPISESAVVERYQSETLHWQLRPGEHTDWLSSTFRRAVPCRPLDTRTPRHRPPKPCLFARHAGRSPLPPFLRPDRPAVWRPIEVVSDIKTDARRDRPPSCSPNSTRTRCVGGLSTAPFGISK